MGQFSLDSSDIISGFDGILKTHNLDFFFFFFYNSYPKSNLQSGGILYILKCFEIKATELYCMDDCTLIHILAKSSFEAVIQP